MSTYSDASLILPVAPEYKAGKIYSLKPTDGTGDFDFSRPTTATRVNEDGLIETVGSNIPRLNYPMIDGVVSGCPSLLLEPQRTNAISYSDTQSAGVWYPYSAWTVSDNSQISPKGILDASSLTENLTNGYHSGYYQPAINNGYTGSYTISCFAKYNGRNIALSPKGATERTVFDLENGTISQLGGGGVTAKIEDYGNGWYRCIVTCSFLNQNVNFEYLLANNNSLQYQGNGTSGVYIYGCQAEQGSYATSYIPTNGSTVTRVAETCNNAGDANTFNDSEGVLFAEISALTRDSGLSRRLTISDGTTNNRVSIELDETEDLVKVFFTGNGTLNQLTSTLNLSNTFKIAVSYQSNSLKLYINGIKKSEDITNIVLPIGLDNLSFHSGTGSSEFYGNVNDLRVYNTALTDAELQALTQV